MQVSLPEIIGKEPTPAPRLLSGSTGIGVWKKNDSVSVIFLPDRVTSHNGPLCEVTLTKPFPLALAHRLVNSGMFCSNTAQGIHAFAV